MTDEQLASKDQGRWAHDLWNVSLLPVRSAETPAAEPARVVPLASRGAPPKGEAPARAAA